MNNIETLMKEMLLLTDGFAKKTESNNYKKMLDDVEGLAEIVSTFYEDIKEENYSKGFKGKVGALFGRDLSSKIKGYSSKRQEIFGEYDKAKSYIGIILKQYDDYLPALKERLDNLLEVMDNPEIEDEERSYIEKHVRPAYFNMHNTYQTECGKMETYKTLEDFIINGEVPFKATFSALIGEIQNQKFAVATGKMLGTIQKTMANASMDQVDRYKKTLLLNQKMENQTVLSSASSSEISLMLAQAQSEVLKLGSGE